MEEGGRSVIGEKVTRWYQRMLTIGYIDVHIFIYFCLNLRKETSRVTGLNNHYW